MTFGDATGSGDVFETAGTINTGGGSCLALPAPARAVLEAFGLQRAQP
jgi:hypothetical protein